MADTEVPVDSLKRRTLDAHCTKIQDGRTPVYKLNLNETTPPGSSFHVYEFGEERTKDVRSKVLMVVGASGSGKTTLINGYVNYMLGVEMEDEFRFQLIPHDPSSSQSQSQTEYVSSYTLHHQEGSKIPFTLTIIDTPGFGDTRGVAKDQEIFKQIHDFFTFEPPVVDHIDAVGFVVTSTQSRLDQTQRYIFNSIMSLFGKDVADNISLMFTFSDQKDPQVLPAIREAGIPFKMYFKFNNSAIFLDESELEEEEDEDEKDPFAAIFWNLGMRSFQGFTEKLEKLEPRSTELTKEVLQCRQDMEAITLKLGPELARCVTRQKELQRELQLEREIMRQDQNRAKSHRASDEHKDKAEGEQEDQSDCEACLVAFVKFLKLCFLACLWFWCCCGCCCTYPRKKLDERKPLLDEAAAPAADAVNAPGSAGDQRARSDVQGEYDPAMKHKTRGKEVEDTRAQFKRYLQELQDKITRLNDIAMNPSGRSVSDYIDLMKTDMSQSELDKELKLKELGTIHAEWKAEC